MDSGSLGLYVLLSVKIFLCVHGQVTFNPDPEDNVRLNITPLTPNVEVTTVQCYMYSSSPNFTVQYVSGIDNDVVFDIKDGTAGAPIENNTCATNEKKYKVTLKSLSFIADPVLVGGTFKLKVTLGNDEGSSTLSQRTYTFPAPFSLTGSSSSAVLNSLFTWTCHVASDYPIIEWIQGERTLGQQGYLPNGTCITAGMNDTYMYNCQQTDKTYTLTIPGTSLTEELQGSTWRCKHVTDEVKGSKFMKLDIIVPVTTVTLTPGNNGSTLDVDEGQAVTFTCTTNSANPPPTILWYIGSTDVTSQAGSNRTTLTANVTRNDKSVKCVAWNSGNTANVSNSTTLNVRYPPVVTLEPSTVEVVEGRIAVLRCSATGNPKPNVTWYRGTEAVTGSSISSSNHTIANINRTATGDYICNATSSYQGSTAQWSNKKTLYLKVFYPPMVSLLIQNTTENTENYKINCTAAGDPNNATFLPLQQRVGSTSIRNITSFTKSSSGNITLTIAKVSYQDMGTYTCLASNGIPDTNNQKIQSDTAYINVNTSAEFEKIKYTMRSDIDKPATVKIGFYKNPPASESDVMWTKNTGASNGTVVSSANVSLSLRDADVNLKVYNVDVTLEGQSAIMNITSFQSYYEGNYTLQIKSSHGDSAEVTIVLMRSGPPDTPSGFKALSSKMTSVVLTWKKGSDGGHPQTFVMLYKETTSMVYAMEKLEDNTMNITVTYEIKSLMSDTSYDFLLYSYNDKGNSSGHMTLQERTTKEMSVLTPGSQSSGLIGGVVGGLVALVVIVALVIVFLKRRLNKGQRSDSKIILNAGNASAGQSRQNDDDDGEDGLKDNPLYGSSMFGAKPAQGPSAAGGNPSLYAEVDKTKKKSPAKKGKEAPPIYAEVDKSNKKSPGKVVDDSPAIYAEVDKTKKKGKGKQKKGKAKDVPEGDEYENIDDLKKNGTKDKKKGEETEQRGYRNQDGLLYVDVKFDQPAQKGKPVIRGEEKTGYAMIEFEEPPTYSTADDVQGAEGGE